MGGVCGYWICKDWARGSADGTASRSAATTMRALRRSMIGDSVGLAPCDWLRFYDALGAGEGDLAGGVGAEGVVR